MDRPRCTACRDVILPEEAYFTLRARDARIASGASLYHAQGYCEMIALIHHARGRDGAVLRAVRGEIPEGASTTQEAGYGKS